MTIQDQINSIKCQLEEAENEYSFAFARADWNTCSFQKKRIASYRAAIGALIKQKLA